MELLEALEKCPVCGFPTSLNSNRAESFESRGGREYLAPLANSEGVDLEHLMAQMQSYRCKKCGADYLEPWLNAYARARVFVTGHPIHNVGWRGLQLWIERGLTPEIPISISLLFEEISRRVGNLTTYVEFGCPFQGLLLGLAPPEDGSLLTGSDGSQFTMSTAIARSRFLPPMYLYLRLTQYVFQLTRYLTRIRRTRDSIRGRRLSSRPQVALPANSFFVPLSSSRFWSANCSMYGGTCAAVVSRFSNITVSSWAEIMKSKVHHFDAAGLFNVLDHQDDPLRLLRDVLKVSKVVICMSHNPPYSKQHHFGLGVDFFCNLPNEIDNCEVVSLSDPVGPNSLFLISVDRSRVDSL